MTCGPLDSLSNMLTSFLLTKALMSERPISTKFRTEKTTFASDVLSFIVYLSLADCLFTLGDMNQ